MICFWSGDPSVASKLGNFKIAELLHFVVQEAGGSMTKDGILGKW